MCSVELRSLKKCQTATYKRVVSYYGLIAPGLGADEGHIQVLLFARDRQVVVTPSHHGGLLLLWAA